MTEVSQYAEVIEAIQHAPIPIVFAIVAGLIVMGMVSINITLNMSRLCTEIRMLREVFENHKEE